MYVLVSPSQAVQTKYYGLFPWGLNKNPRFPPTSVPSLPIDVHSQQQSEVLPDASAPTLSHLLQSFKLVNQVQDNAGVGLQLR